MVRSVVSVLAGYATTAVIVMIVTFGGGAVLDGAPYLTANIAGSVVAAMTGGYVCAVVARRNPVAHSVVLAMIMLVLGLAMGTGGPEPGQPSWYPLVIPIIGALGSTAGGVLRRAQTARREVPPSGVAA